MEGRRVEEAVGLLPADGGIGQIAGVDLSRLVCFRDARQCARTCIPLQVAPWVMSRIDVGILIGRAVVDVEQPLAHAEIVERQADALVAERQYASDWRRRCRRRSPSLGRGVFERAAVRGEGVVSSCGYCRRTRWSAPAPSRPG